MEDTEEPGNPDQSAEKFYRSSFENKTPDKPLEPSFEEEEGDQTEDTFVNQDPEDENSKEGGSLEISEPNPSEPRSIDDDSLFIPFISIPRAERLADGKSNYVAYVVELNDGAVDTTVLRRFKQFSELHEALKKKHPDVEFPSFPSKTLFKNSSKEFIETRRIMLEKYLQQLCKKNEKIRSDPEMKKFLREKKEGATENLYWKGRRILVIGASSSLGEELASQYAGKGAVRLVIASNSAPSLEKLNQRIGTLGKGADVKIIVGDATHLESCNKLIGAALAELGGLDILVISLDEGVQENFLEINIETLQEKLMQTTNANYFSIVYCTHLALPSLKQSRGTLMVVSSAAGKIGVPSLSLYSAAQHAIQGFISSLRREVPEVGFTVVCLGYEKHIGGEDNTSTEESAAKIIDSVRSRTREVLFGGLVNVKGLLLNQYVEAKFRKSMSLRKDQTVSIIKE